MSGRPVGTLTAIALALLAGHLSVASPTPTPTVHAGPVLPRAAAAPLPGLPTDAPEPTATGVRSRISSLLADPLLGNPQSLVVDAQSGQVLLDDRSTQPGTPASTVKTVVAAATLATLGADAKLTTRVLYLPPVPPPSPSGTPSPSGAPSTALTDGGTLWIVGAGDTTLTAATGPATYPAPGRLSDLADQVRRAGITRVSRVVGDGSLFTGPSTAAGWRDSYITTGNITPVSALEVDGGRSSPGDLGPRSLTSTLAAADAFAVALRRSGVTVGSVGTGSARVGSAREVASVQSPSVGVLVEQMLTASNDDQAEAFGRLVAIARGLPPTFAGATAAVTGVLGELGVPTAGLSLSDASGLSVLDQLTPATLVALLRTAVLPGHPQLRTLLTGLPVAAFSGTLTERYRGPADRSAAGDVRAKTGSLRTVTALAGQVVDVDGRLLLFAFLAPVAQSDATSGALDRVAAALGECGCSAPG